MMLKFLKKKLSAYLRRVKKHLGVASPEKNLHLKLWCSDKYACQAVRIKHSVSHTLELC